MVMKMMFCTFGHLPSRDENGSEYEAEHGEEHRDRANHPITAHLMNNNIIISNGKQNCISQIEGGVDILLSVCGSLMIYLAHQTSLLAIASRIAFLK